MLSAILNTWLPRSNFIYSNNTLLAAGCCKSKLRYLKHWYRLLCPGLACENIRFYSLFVSQASPGLVKPILGHSFGRSWYMRLFHTPRTSFLLTTRLWKHNSCSVLFLFQERTWERPLEPFWIPLCVSVHKSTTWNQNIYEKFQRLLLADRSAPIACGRWRQVLLFVMQSLLHPDFGCDTRFAEWFCVRPFFLFSTPPPPIQSFLFPSPLGRPDTQVNNNRSRYEIISAIQKEICQVL